MLIEKKIKILFVIGILLLFVIINTNGSLQSKNRAEKLIQKICEDLSDKDLYDEENQQWENFCKKWFKSIGYQQHDDIQSEDTIDESYMTNNRSPRRSGSGSRSSSSSSRSSSSRASSSGSRTSRVSTSISRASSGSRIGSSISQYRNTRTGAVISRPTGSLWSRTRHTFVPVSHHYYYRSYSSRYPNGSPGYYYCTSNGSVVMEIQCSTSNGDNQCCEDETSHQAFCCGGKIDEDLVEDFNRSTRILARIFYTLAAIAFFMHIFMRRLY